MDENKTIDTNTAEAGKTFTQEDVNRIVSERLTREKQKQDSDLQEREQKLAQRELMLTAKEKVTARGYSDKIIEALNCTSAEALEKSLTLLDEAIAERAKKMPRGFTGFVPASGSASGAADEQSRQNDAVRKAMGLK